MFREGDPRRDMRQKSIHHNRRFVRPPAINRRSGHAGFFRDAFQGHSPESVLLKQADGRLEDFLEGMAVGEVVESKDPDFATGDTVMSMMGWREVFDAPAAALQKPEVKVSSPQMYLGVCGNTGQTAYIGLADVIKLQPGEVIFISGAAGAVGSIACQIAKLMGATVIASAGGVEKCAYLKQLGIEKVIDYKKTENLSQALAEIAPSGIDAYFDNVGGDHLDAALASAKTFARFALCGMISGYDKTVSGPSNLLMAIEKRLLLEGFFVPDHFSRRAEFIEKMNRWIRNGDVTYRETVEVGIERAPAAFLKLFSGA